MSVRIGDTVPKFNLEATSNLTITESDLKGHYTVLYFYPKDNTPGCTTEGVDFSEHLSDFQALNTQILGVSKDSIKKHENFKTKYDFPFELISDGDEVLCQLFDVIKLKKNYGREYLGIERSTFLIDPNGKLIHEWRKVKVKDHVTDVLTQLRQLQSH
ncbi:peroxiredoxin [Hydrogenovibrio sp. JE_KL2]|uniref:peroxiredoxin n=1 Tax=Hydrogenovibrio sp. JE_KL2 TaxID=2651188 RepID=UPI00128DF93D|nr:peroxiredoxin [Hydrogenovibrio sp. JE_KL2]MPQ75640.1 peroxiredoxin [Hydrogenovibrio sp. JE_KL2]